MRAWDTRNKRWLEVMSISFSGEDIVKIEAKVPGSNILATGWYTVEREDLAKVAIVGAVLHNTDLLPIPEGK